VSDDEEEVKEEGEEKEGEVEEVKPEDEAKEKKVGGVPRSAAPHVLGYKPTRGRLQVHLHCCWLTSRWPCLCSRLPAWRRRRR
jgi:hypothetical protein